ncbi:MAG: YigZ family protein [Prevotella sp.]|nr:YigZ family protein [Prevotella sp.]MCM1074303.1 YigZ family protein [Ruminococcus sp.]
MSDVFYTISSPSQGQIREKMSRFLAFAHPVKTVEEAKQVIKDYQNEYHDARHVCWAYTIGADRAVWQLNDNGEPSGTAGKPILGQINSLNLTDIVIVVVRYFGGIKLGTPGLIAAYRAAAKEAIENAEIIECHDMESLTFHFPYLAMNDVMRMLKRSQVVIDNQKFDNSCEISLSIRKDMAEGLRIALENIDGVTFEDADTLKPE